MIEGTSYFVSERCIDMYITEMIWAAVYYSFAVVNCFKLGITQYFNDLCLKTTQNLKSDS